jgi:hypothetical protein
MIGMSQIESRKNQSYENLNWPIEPTIRPTASKNDKMGPSPKLAVKNEEG